MHRHTLASSALLLLSLGLFAAGCGSGDTADVAGSEGAFSSNQATLLDFEFDGELVSDDVWDDHQVISDQLLYTIGHLNGDRGVGRLDNVTLTNVTHAQEGSMTKVSYHAKLPVAWGAQTDLPTSYQFILPRDVSQGGQQAFTDKHNSTCADGEGETVDTGSMWYYYRPHQDGCDVTDAEVIKTTAKVTRSKDNTTGKYPEYQKVWEDNRLEVVAIFGKFEAGATSGDAGIDGFNEYVARMKSELGAMSLVTTPANVADRPGPAVMDVTLEAKLADGKQVKVTALLVDAITQVWPGFQARYESLTPTADVIAYNGHSGLGQNVRALAQMGRWVAGKYQIFFMNGCDSFAYVDGSLAQTRAQLNPDDPSGTKYMEFVTNAMPSFFSSMPNASAALMKGLMSTASPMTYEKIFENVDDAEVVLVTGEEDNVFQPGMPLGTP